MNVRFVADGRHVRVGGIRRPDRSLDQRTLCRDCSGSRSASPQRRSRRCADVQRRGGSFRFRENRSAPAPWRASAHRRRSDPQPLATASSRSKFRLNTVVRPAQTCRRLRSSEAARSAMWCGLHSAVVYRVYMLGFLPGFAYMGSVDARIAMPRLDTPRARVPAGSVGIAGAQTGIYPCDTPGGWRIIGRTATKMFDPARANPFLLEGRRPREVRCGVRDAGACRSVAPGCSRQCRILAGGVFSRAAFRSAVRWIGTRIGLANRLVGNPDAAATLEVTMMGPRDRV